MIFDRKAHIKSVHLNLRYSCIWPNCTWTTGVAKVKYHRRRAHTQWSIESQLCEDQFDIWWDSIHPWYMNTHKARKDPVEWEEEQLAYKLEHVLCKFKNCFNRFEAKVERHKKKMH